MRVLIAEDDAVSRRLLEATLTKLGFEVISTEDGIEALHELSKTDAPKLAIIDWMMPNLDGLEVCRELEKRNDPEPVYVILLTARGSKEDIVTGLNSGADDYITKPFNREELLARVNVGQRIVELQCNLSQRVNELQEALNEVKHLQGMLPICSYCKKVRDDNNYWQQVEEYLSDRSEAKFSHSVCPECEEKYVKPQLEELAKRLETVSESEEE